MQFPLDAETRALESPGDHREELRLWLRMLACSSVIETDIRRRLRRQFGVTLPRFDLMAQLERAPGGMTLSEISKRMMVSNGNLTALVERLVQSGRLARTPSPRDGRAQLISLTRLGRRAFKVMAAQHSVWIADLFAGLPRRDIADLSKLLAVAKASAQTSIARREPN